MSRKLRLGLWGIASSNHRGAWRLGSGPQNREEIELAANAIRIAENSLFHYAFMGDVLKRIYPGSDNVQPHLDPLIALSALSQATRHIGLIATAATSFSDPFALARQFASLDIVSHGRAGWNVVTGLDREIAESFSFGELPGHDHRYDIAGEFVDVALGYWDTWAPGALVIDKASGVYADSRRIREFRYEGKFFKVAGVLPSSRPPQGRPVLFQAGSSPEGIAFGARFADGVFTAQDTLASAREFYRAYKDAVGNAGRDPAKSLVLPGALVILGRSEAEAREKYDQLAESIDLKGARNQLEFLLGVKLDGLSPDVPVPDLPQFQGLRSRAALLYRKAVEKKLTVDQLAREVGISKGHLVVVGTPKQVADVFEEWLVEEAVDGFNVGPAIVPDMLELFGQEVVPELQRRGRFRTEQGGPLLRDSLGVS